ncbi:MAG: nucleotidyl transferase AbiEii/AbiGii toxin family protein [Acidobacteria bacterium]|nr:nucleotidyl transferase AbiEii/AbiGii toxin family protein [Acidobacteriota bacterium]
MDSVAKLPTEERALLFAEAAARRGVLPVVIEKDFWVCWTLKRLFELPDINTHLIFKGGTSLSKVFGIIERFSEDIDLSINRAYLGFGGEHEPERAGGKNKVQHRIEELVEASRAKITGELLPALRGAFHSVLNDVEEDAGRTQWSLVQDASEPQDLYFTYPRHESSLKWQGSDYLKPVVKIEMGARADHWPAGEYPVTPYAAEQFPNYFSEPTCHVKVLEAERTFWEKATILHAEYHRPEGRATADRISRHYYDLHRLAASQVAGNALKRLDLLDRVVEHKSVFFRSAWARYSEARTGQIRLLPAAERLASLRVDYDKMKDMFFGERPPFDEVLNTLAALEERVNARTAERDANI